jgi:ADP-ribose pyrophosphatase YjhB (NUDIX family)
MFKRFVSRLWRLVPPALQRRAILGFQAKFTVTAAAVVLDARDRVLLVEHTLRPGPAWGIPGGFLERGEDPEVALRRELREELALEVTDVRIVFARSVAVAAQIQLVFVARAAGEPSPRTIEIGSFAWAELDAMPDYISDGQRRVIARALEATR